MLIEAWDIERDFPYAERQQKLVVLGGRKGAEEVVNAVLVDHLVGGGKYEEAETVAARLLKDSPSAWSYAAASNVALAMEGPTAALELAQKALELDPANAFALSAAYTAAQSFGNRKGASDYAARLAAIDPASVRFVGLHICAVLVSGDLAQARNLLGKAPAEFAGSAESEAVAAFFSFRDGQFGVAADHAATASALEPHLVGHWLLQAEFLNIVGQPAEAEALAGRALVINPRCERALEVMVEAARERRNWDLYYQREAALDTCTPYRVALEHCMAADRFNQRGHTAAAVRAYQMSIDSRHPGARRIAQLGLINVWLGQRRWQQLVPMLAEFESETPVPTIVVLARAGIAAANRDWDEAIRVLEAAIESADEQGDAISSWLMHYLYRAHRFPRLAEVATAILDQPGYSDQIAFDALMALYQVHETESADEHLALCRQRFPRSDAILWMQARRLRAKGDKKAARAIWRQLSPQMRRWNPDARAPGPLKAYVQSLGAQFRRVFVRW